MRTIQRTVPLHDLVFLFLVFSSQGICRFHKATVILPSCLLSSPTSVISMYQHNACNSPCPAPAQQVLCCSVRRRSSFSNLTSHLNSPRVIVVLESTHHVHLHADVHNPRTQTHIPHRGRGRSRHSPDRHRGPLLLKQHHRQSTLQTPTRAPVPRRTTRARKDAAPARGSGHAGRRLRARRGAVHARARSRRCGPECRRGAAYEPRVVLCEHAAAAAPRGGAGLRCGAGAGPARRDGGAEAVDCAAGAQGDGGALVIFFWFRV
ncbi:hypothetical protein EDB89DRAFT_713480 [Lactarius sanguifluus]|nr:hypothetical protein EDB89DRAFT_713480 [Lactarius sanguifluus]